MKKEIIIGILCGVFIFFLAALVLFDFNNQKELKLL